MDVPAGVTQEEGHTGFLIHLPSAVRALIFVENMNFVALYAGEFPSYSSIAYFTSYQ